MANITFDCNVNSVKIGSAGDITVDLTKFNAEVACHIFTYGLKQILNDTRSAEKDGEKALALVGKKLEALYEGKVRAAGERETDPVKAEARKIAAGQIMAALKAKGIKKDALPEGKFAELVKAQAGKESVMAVARKNVEAAKALMVADELLAGLDDLETEEAETETVEG